MNPDIRPKKKNVSSPRERFRDFLFIYQLAEVVVGMKIIVRLCIGIISEAVVFQD